MLALCNTLQKSGANEKKITLHYNIILKYKLTNTPCEMTGQQ